MPQGFQCHHIIKSLTRCRTHGCSFNTRLCQLHSQFSHELFSKLDVINVRRSMRLTHTRGEREKIISLINSRVHHHREMRSVNQWNMIQVTIYNNYFCCQQCGANATLYIYCINSGKNNRNARGEPLANIKITRATQGNSQEA